MEQLRDLADDRLVNGCIYCGGFEETREHVPSKVLLNEPFPENLPIVRACRKCNNGYSQDEEYVACLIECMIVGSTDPEQIKNSKIAKILLRNPGLRSRIENKKYILGDRTLFEIEEERFLNVIRKLALGHAVFELSQVLRDKPYSINCWYLDMMSEEQRDSYDIAHVTELIGEIGSRNTQRLFVTELTLQSSSGDMKSLNVVINDWLDVQEGRYRYIAIDHGDSIEVKIVFSEFIACEIIWDLSDKDSDTVDR